ncbi:MAG: ATP-dependent zinc metalloprotease FtsH [Candidatus Edwardsbacteria bacterium]
MATEKSDKEQKKPLSTQDFKRANKGWLFWIIFILIVFIAYNLFNIQKKEMEISYTQFRQELLRGNISTIIFKEKEVQGVLKTPIVLSKRGVSFTFNRFKTYVPFEEPGLISELQSKGVEIKAEPEGKGWFTVLATWWLPAILLVVFWLFVIRQTQAGPKGIFSFGKSRARLLTEDKIKVNFRDVAGAEEAKQDLKEIIEFLKEPKKFQRLGGKIPKGALLLGPPGTGKTLMAKAVAGEAGVPFYSISGSDFVEMFVGVGASRVRDLFEQGKKNAPCIIFIDEIDAVGRHRGAGLGGGHDEREQTLNQLLVEMDGFSGNEGVIIIAATNRPDVLDPALLRPGRFDRIIVVDRPDVIGREGIFKVHTKKIPLAEDVDLKVLARGTPGFSGADIANMVNEAALLAARHNRNKVIMQDFEEAKDRVMMGAERKSMFISEEEKKISAYHESGHTLVSKMTSGMDPIHKVTIIPRGRALGITLQLPIDERHNYSKTYCLNQLAFILGGRAAEELVLHEMTTGAGNDIERATELARKMVCEWGMSESLGPLTFGQKEEEIFLGREFARHRDYSEETAQAIDKEIRQLVENAHQRAFSILQENIDKLHALAKTLLEREILDGEEIDKIIKGETLSSEEKTDEENRPPQDRKSDKIAT